MNKVALNHHKAHRSPQWPTSATAGRPHRACRHDVADRAGRGGGAPLARGPFGRTFPPARESLNWSLRRYVRASSLRVWLRRQAPRAGGAPVTVGSGVILRAAPRSKTTRKASSPALVARIGGVSLSMDDSLRYRIHRNRQMEHFTQLAASLRGGVRHGAAITPRERSAAWDLVLTTLSNAMCV